MTLTRAFSMSGMEIIPLLRLSSCVLMKKAPIPPSFDRSRLYFNLAYTYNGRGQWDSALSVLDSAKIGLKDQNILDGIKQTENHVKMSALTGNGVDTDGRR
jgi:hypothetical protein